MQYPVIDLITQAYINNRWTGLDLKYGKNMIPNEKAQDTRNRVLLGTSTNIGYNVFLPAGTYIASFYTSNPSVGFYWRISPTEPVQNTLRINLTNDTYLRIWLYSGSGVTVDEVIWFQIERGTNSTPYEPYTPPTSDIDHRLKLPLLHYFPHPVIDALKRASDGTMTDNDKQILRHYLTPLGIGGI